MTYVLGIASVWLYAAIRPRYGAGAGTAAIAGVAVWVIAHLWSGVYLGMGFLSMIPPKLAYLPVAWGLIEAPLGTVAGAWLYKEDESVAARPGLTLVVPAPDRGVRTDGRHPASGRHRTARRDRRGRRARRGRPRSG